MGGVFTFVGTHGIPLEVVLGMLKERGLVVSWIDYVNEASRQGAKMRSIRAKVMVSVGEVYGPKYLRGFEARWSEWFGE